MYSTLLPRHKPRKQSLSGFPNCDSPRLLNVATPQRPRDRRAAKQPEDIPAPHGVPPRVLRPSTACTIRTAAFKDPFFNSTAVNSLAWLLGLTDRWQLDMVESVLSAAQDHLCMNDEIT
jgi:hypothetical protein